MTNSWRRLALAICLMLRASAYTAPAAAADASSPWLPGADAVGDDTFTSAIDSPVAGSVVAINQNVVVQGWVVDRTASDSSGIDDVQVFLGVQDQGGTLLARASVGQRRDDVAAALGNPNWANSGFSTSFANSGLGVGPNWLAIYAHSPAKGWWYRQVEVRMPAPPDRPFADDPLLIVREAVPSLDVITAATTKLTLRGYAIDRNMPSNVVLGAGGSGVSQVQVFLDGPRNPGNGAGTFLGNATLGQKNREATGFGQRFLMSGWEITLHPSDFSVDRHEFFIYAMSAFWPSETLVIIPFEVR